MSLRSEVGYRQSDAPVVLGARRLRLPPSGTANRPGDRRRPHWIERSAMSYVSRGKFGMQENPSGRGILLPAARNVRVSESLHAVSECVTVPTPTAAWGPPGDSFHRIGRRAGGRGRGGQAKQEPGRSGGIHRSQRQPRVLQRNRYGARRHRAGRNPGAGRDVGFPGEAAGKCIRRPEPQRAVVSGRDDRPAVRRGGHGVDRPGVAAEAVGLAQNCRRPIRARVRRCRRSRRTCRGERPPARRCRSASCGCAGR